MSIALPHPNNVPTIMNKNFDKLKADPNKFVEVLHPVKQGDKIIGYMVTKYFRDKEGEGGTWYEILPTHNNQSVDELRDKDNSNKGTA